MRTVFHLNEEERAEGLLRNVSNLLADWEEDGDAAVVAHSTGIRALTPGPLEEKVKNLMSRGTTFHACRNTLDGAGMDEDDLIDGVETVSSGVAALTEFQEEGYRYIKP